MGLLVSKSKGWTVGSGGDVKGSVEGGWVETVRIVLHFFIDVIEIVFICCILIWCRLYEFCVMLLLISGFMDNACEFLWVILIWNHENLWFYFIKKKKYLSPKFSQLFVAKCYKFNMEMTIAVQ